MKRYVMKNGFVLFLLLASFIAGAQEREEEGEEKKGFQREKLFIGGNFGLSFGDYTILNLSPQLGYRFNRFFAAGAGVNAQYVSIKERNFYGDPIQKESLGVFGLNLFGRIYPFQYMMLQVQPEYNYITRKQTYYETTGEFSYKDNFFVPSLLAGGGVVLPSERSAFIVALMYDVLQKPNNPYGKRPVLHIGYNIGL